VAYLVKIIVIVLSVLTFVFAIVSMILMVGATLVSSFCDFNQEILDQSDFGSFLASYNIEMEQQELSFLNECIPASAGGDVVKILNVPTTFNDIQDMVDGFSGFNNFKKVLEEAPEDSVTVTETVNVWK